MPDSAKALVNGLYQIHAKLGVELTRAGEDAVITDADKALDSIRKQAKASKGKKATPEPQTVLDAITAGERTDIVSAARDIARWYFEQGLTDRETIYTRVHGELARIFPAITRIETVNAIAGYGRFRALSKDAIDIQMRDLIGQSLQLARIRAMREGKAPLKVAEPRPISDAERHLTQIVNELKRQGKYSVTDPTRQLRTALDAIKARLDNQIADLNQEISTGEKINKTRTTVEYDAEAKAKRAERDRLVKIRNEIFKAPGITDEARIKRTVAALERSLREYERRITERDYFATNAKSAAPEDVRIDALKARIASTKQQLEWLKKMAKPEMRTAEELAEDVWEERVLARMTDLKDRLARGDFATTPRPERVLTPRMEKIKAKLVKVEADFEAAKRRWRWQQKSAPAKAFDLTLDTFDLVRAIWTGLDLSPILRQGIMPLLTNPITTIKEIGKAFPSIASEEAAVIHMNRLRETPEYARYVRYKTPFTEVGGPLERQDELVTSNLARHIPVLAGTQRFYTALLNGLRFSMLQMGEKAFAPNGKYTNEQGKAMAFYVGAATGRGSIGSLDRAGVWLNRVFFSPRLFASNLQMLVGMPIWKASDAKVRKYIAGQYARMAIGWAGIYTLGYLAGGELEQDWRSSDFGKIRFGNTRIDPLRGMSQVIVLTGRTLTGERKTGTGRIVAIRGPDTPFKGMTVADVMENFIRSKFAPAISIPFDIAVGETVVGQPVDPRSMKMWTRLITPMAGQDIYQAIQEQGMPEGTAMGLLFLLGFGGMTYERKTKRIIPRSPYRLPVR